MDLDYWREDGHLLLLCHDVGVKKIMFPELLQMDGRGMDRLKNALEIIIR